MFTCIGAYCWGNMPEPYNSINVLPFDSHGWFGNGEQLEKIINNHKPKVVIEVGSWLGTSTRFLAERSEKVYAIDTWQGSPQEEDVMNNPRLPYLYQQFLSNVIHSDLTEKIIPIKLTSLEASKALKVKANLIYIDGAHDTNSVVQDIIAWYPHLDNNGIMCGDDWLCPTVREAVTQCAVKLNKKIISQDNFWNYE